MRKRIFKTLLLIIGMSSVSSYSATPSTSDLVDALVSSGDQIAGLEVLVAAGSAEAASSSFGHAMLRFVKKDGNFATDPVLSFVANVSEDRIDWIKGLDGDYAVLPLIGPVEEFWTRYVLDENRPLERYIVVSSAAQRARLLSTLKAWIADPEKIGKYTFLSNNCAGALARLFEEAGFPHLDLIAPRAPTRLSLWLRRSLLSPYPELKVETPNGLLNEGAATLNLSREHLLSGKNWPADAAEKLKKQFSDRDLKILLLVLPAMPCEVRLSILKSHPFNNGGATLEDALGFKTVPQNLYQLCASDECARDLAAKSRTVWSDFEWQEALREDDFAYWLIFHSESGDSRINYREDPLIKPAALREHVTHMQLLLRTRSF